MATWNKDTALATLGIEQRPFGACCEDEERARAFDNSGLLGYSLVSGKSVVICLREGQDQKRELHTVLHELAHCVLGHVHLSPDIDLPRWLGEVEAESAAYIAMQMLGILDDDQKTESAQYIFSYLEGRELPDTAVERAKEAASLIVAAGQ